MTIRKVVFSQQAKDALIKALLFTLSAWVVVIVAVVLKVDNLYWAAMPV